MNTTIQMYSVSWNLLKMESGQDIMYPIRVYNFQLNQFFIFCIYIFPAIYVLVFQAVSFP